MSNFIQNNIDKQHSMQQQYWDQMVKQNQQLQQQQQHHGATSSRVEYKNICVQKLRNQEDLLLIYLVSTR